MDENDFFTIFTYSIAEENCDRCIQLIYDGVVDISYFNFALSLMQRNIDKILKAFLHKYPELVQTDFCKTIPAVSVELGGYNIDYKSIIEYTVKHGGSPGSVYRYNQFKYLFNEQEQKQLDIYISLYNPNDDDFNHYCRFVLNNKNKELTIAESVQII